MIIKTIIIKRTNRRRHTHDKQKGKQTQYWPLLAVCSAGKCCGECEGESDEAAFLVTLGRNE